VHYSQLAVVLAHTLTSELTGKLAFAQASLLAYDTWIVFNKRLSIFEQIFFIFIVIVLFKVKRGYIIAIIISKNTILS